MTGMPEDMSQWNDWWNDNMEEWHELKKSMDDDASSGDDQKIHFIDPDKDSPLLSFKRGHCVNCGKVNFAIFNNRPVNFCPYCNGNFVRVDP